MKLFVKNDKEEFIADVKFDREIVTSAGHDLADEKLLIACYSKEPGVICPPQHDPHYCRIFMIGTDVENDKKLQKFAKYLQDRKKAGEVYHLGFKIHILPPATASFSPIACYIPVKLLKDQEVARPNVSSTPVPELEFEKNISDQASEEQPLATTKIPPSINNDTVAVKVEPGSLVNKESLSNGVKSVAEKIHPSDLQNSLHTSLSTSLLTSASASTIESVPIPAVEASTASETVYIKKEKSAAPQSVNSTTKDTTSNTKDTTNSIASGNNNNNSSGSGSNSGVSVAKKVSAATTTGIPALPAVKTSAPNFLSALVGQITATNKVRAETQKLQQADTKVKSYLEQLETRLKKEFVRFEVDSNLFEISLEPMNKDMRTCVHNIVEEYPELQSASVGDFEDRHVVIFRKGYQPVGVELSNKVIALSRGTNIKPATRKPANGNVNGNNSNIGAENMFADSVIKVDQVKRDRRTIEEVEEDMKRRRLGGAHQPSSHSED